MNESRTSKSARRLAAACLLVLLSPLPARPQQPPDQPPAPTPQPKLQKTLLKVEVQAPVPVDIPLKDGVIELTIDQAIEIALRRNLGIVIERYNRIHARLGIYEALGIYDLHALADLVATNSKSAVTTSTRPGNTREEDLNFSLAQAFPTGGTLSLGIGNSHVFQEFTNASLNTIGTSFYTSGFTFSYVQPLLRNFGREAFEHGLLVAQNASGVSQATFFTQLTSNLQQVINTYWSVVNAQGQLVVAQDALGLARELHERNKIQVQVGTLAPLDLVQSQANIATSEEGIISAQEQVGNAEDQLRRLLDFPPGELWKAEIKPLTDARTDERLTIDLDQAIAQALKNRPELVSEQLAVELAKLNARFIHNQARPALNLTVDYGAGGAATGFGGAFSQSTNLTFPTWSAALHLDVPIQNRTARASATIADLDADRTKIELDQLKTVVITDVRQAARRVETAAKQIDAAVAARKAQETNLDAERKRYENGISTTFVVTQIQQQLTQSKSVEITAIVGYRTAIADYYRAIGALPAQSGVEIEDRDPRPRRFTVTPRADEKVYEKQ